VQYVNDVVFAHFAESECGQRSAAVALNPSQTDFTPPMSFAGIAYVNVDYEARFALGRSETTAGDCSGACDSYDFASIVDDDGSVTGVSGSTVLGEYAPLALPSPTCTWVGPWGGSICTGVVFRAVTATGIFGRAQTVKRTVGPVQIRRLADPTVENDEDREYGSVGDFIDPCPMIMPGPKFRFLVVVNRAHDVNFVNDLPPRVDFRFFSDSPDEALVFKLFVFHPFALDMFMDGAAVPSTMGLVPTLASPAGENVFNPQGP
jgi:hypothetical protein